LTPRGIYAAALTPFARDLQIDTERLIRHCRDVLVRGCDGVSLFGTTGEANSLAVAERTAALERVVDAGIAPQRLMPGTGCCALPDTIALTHHALALGVTAVLVLPPFYYKNPSDEGLFDAYAHIIETVADDRLRMYLYHIPQFSGVPLSIALVERLRAAYPRTVVGIKDSSGDFANAQALCALGDFGVFIGAERLIVKTLDLGGAGTICALANIVPETLADLYARRSAPEAAALQARVCAQLDVLDRFGFIGALKALLAARDAAQDWQTVRPPLRALASAQHAALHAAFDGLALTT